MPVAAGVFFTFDAVIIALALALMALAILAIMRPIITFLANAANDIPVLGGWLSDELRDMNTAVNNWIHNLVTDAWRAGSKPFVDSMTTYGNTHSGDAYSLRLLLTRMATMIGIAVHNSTNIVNSPTQSYVTNSSTVNNTYVLANTDAAVTQSEAYTQTSYGQLADWANTAVQSVYNDVVDADGRVATLARQEAADILTANTYAEGVSAAAEGNAVLRANAYTLASFHTGEDYTTQVRDYATSINADTRTWTEGQIQTNVRAIEELLTAGIGAVVTSVGVLEADYTTFKNTCGDPLCEGLLDFAKGMTAIKRLFSVGIMAAFLVEIVHDPEGSAKAAVAITDTLTAPAVAVYHDIFGG